MNVKPHRLNVVGDFFVEQDCCTHCGVPEVEAPDLFGWHEESCYVKKQPTSEDETSRMLRAIAVQELGCVRYKGTDAGLLERLRGIDDGAHIVGPDSHPVFATCPAPQRVTLGQRIARLFRF